MRGRRRFAKSAFAQSFSKFFSSLSKKKKKKKNIINKEQRKRTTEKNECSINTFCPSVKCEGGDATA
jgi:hypothetical protein